MKHTIRRPPLDFGAIDDPPSEPGETGPDLAGATGEPQAQPREEAWPLTAAEPRSAEGSSTDREVAASAGRPPARDADASTELQVEDAAFEAAFAPPAGWPIYLAAFAVSVLWAIGPIAFAVGYRKGTAPLHDDAFAMTVFGLLAIGPALLVFVAAYLIRQGQRLSAESRRAKAMAERMLAPSLLAAARAGEVAQGVREEIHRAATAADNARETLLALRRALSVETEQLVQTTRNSMTAAQALAGELGRERDEMRGLAQALDVQAVKVADTITRQARMVAEASEVADAQLREAEAALSARAADLAAAASEAGDTARTAGEDLVRHIARLEAAGVGVADQVRAVEGGLSEQRVALVNLSQALRADHEGFAEEADAHTAKLNDFIKQTRISAFEVSDRATKGGEALKQLVADAAERLRELTAAAAVERDNLGQSSVARLRDLSVAAAAERDAFGRSAVQSLSAVSDAAAEQRERLEAEAQSAIGALGRAADETREATARHLAAVSAAAAEQRERLEAETHAAIGALARAADETREATVRHAVAAREQVDQLSEAAFVAGQKANQVFEARLEEARALIEQSSKMVEQAGAATARKLDEGAAAARATLAELQAMMNELEARTRELPTSAREQAEQVRALVEQGMDELTAHARRTAEEAQAIDAAFQERVRRNFEMLSEAVRLMGTAAATPSGGAAFAQLATPTEPAAARAPFTANYSRPTVRTPPPAATGATPEPSPPASAAEPLIDKGAEPAAVKPAARAKPEAPKAEPPKAETGPDVDTPPAAEPDASKISGSALAERLGMRPRLKLTPTATDTEFSAIFESAGSAARPEPAARDSDETDEGEAGETWTWKDLLASIGGADGEPAGVETRLAAELGKMGVSPESLLPKPRIEAIAAAVQTGDRDGARQVVKRLAASAVRRIVRRLFTDAAMKADAVAFVRSYRTLLDDAVVRDPEGFLMADLLSSEAGRIYLLFDAAGGDEV